LLVNISDLRGKSYTCCTAPTPTRSMFTTPATYVITTETSSSRNDVPVPAATTGQYARLCACARAAWSLRRV